MKKTILILFSILMLVTMLIGAAISVSAETANIIPVPEVPAIDRPYKTIQELGIDYEKIDAYFPRQIEIRYEEGKVYVEDFGARSIEIYDHNIYSYVSLELIDGYWTAELSDAPTIIYVYCYETSIYDRNVNVSYYGDGRRDHYIGLRDSVIGVDVSFAFEYRNVTVLYESGNCYYEDRYENGVLATHGVSNREDEEGTNQVIYGADGEMRYCTLYTDGYYHYFPEQGWSSNWEKFVACDPPAGYENVDETYFTANKPSLICVEAKGDDIVHDMSTAHCTTPSTCKNGCGYTVGTIEHHDWQIVDNKKECSLCGAVFFPDFEFIDRTYNMFEKSGFPCDEIKALFPEVLDVKYEDGKYMAKDVCADKATAYNSVGYEDIELSLVDGWWICELDEEIYNDESINIFVSFEGEIGDIYWDITYINGKVDNYLYLLSTRDDFSVSVYYNNYDRVIPTYCIGDRLYLDEYINGALDMQEASLFTGEDHIYASYLADGSFDRAYVHTNDEWFYYYPEKGWVMSDETPIDPPMGYENANAAYFKSILPTTINCTHERYSEADCLNPERCLVCGIDKEGSTALGHDYDDGVITLAPTCMESGIRLFTCRHDSRHTYTIEEAIVENAHAWDEGVIKTHPTCSEVGEKLFTCTHNDEHTYTEDIDALGHKYDNVCDATCNTCGEERIPADHVVEDGNNTCNICGAELPKDGLSGGAIAGIAVGSTAAVGLGGFSLLWFVIKKKKWSDLIGIFKK